MLVGHKLQPTDSQLSQRSPVSKSPPVSGFVILGRLPENKDGPRPENKVSMG